MEDLQLFETILDNLADGIYVLDHKGDYIYVNTTYSQILNTPKSVLLSYNVHDFITNDQIDYCISDFVYREKRQVIMFQDVRDPSGRKGTFRQIVISTPIFDDNGDISNVIAIVRPVDRMNKVYETATANTVSSHFIPLDSEPHHSDPIIAESPLMKEVLEVASMVATVDSSVLITGQSGTGKELVAEFIHKASKRSQREMVVINCASLPEHLLEAELFGYEKGAFTGASQSGKKGLFEVADGSTLLLDEINSLPMNLQGKLLRAIETKTIQRIGSTTVRDVDFRLIAATNENLAKLVQEKRFRADLYYRLNVVPIYLPPLSQRREDILPIAESFLNRFCRRYSKDKVFTENTVEAIQNYDWPGNVRELKNFVERSVVMTSGRDIEIQNIGAFISHSNHVPRSGYTTMAAPLNQNLPQDVAYELMLESGVSLDEYLAECEKGYMGYAMEKYHNSYKAAKALGTSQSSIMRRKKKYSL